jgi:hypothetical protein
MMAPTIIGRSTLDPQTRKAGSPLVDLCDAERGRPSRPPVHHRNAGDFRYTVVEPADAGAVTALTVLHGGRGYEAR